MENKYLTLCDKYDEIGSHNELTHILQDKIYRKFINDIAKKNINGKEIHKIAKILKKRIIKYRNVFYLRLCKSIH